MPQFFRQNNLHKLLHTTSLVLAVATSVNAQSPVNNAFQPRDFYGELAPHHSLTFPPPVRERTPPAPEPEGATLNNESSIISTDASSLLAETGVKNADLRDFSPRVWAFFTQSEAMAYLSHIPRPLEQTPLRTSILSLLMMQGEPPQQSDDKWFNARLATLLALNAFDEATKLAASPQGNLRDAIHPLLRLHIALRSDNIADACHVVQTTDAAPQSVDTNSWQRLLWFCQAKAGETAKVTLALSLAEESGQPQPEWFTLMIDSLEDADALAAIKPPTDAEQLDRDMFDAALGTKKSEAQPAPLWAKEPAAALMAYRELMSKGDYSAVGEWLGLMERTQPDSTYTYLAHELARFVTDHSTVRSPEASNILPFKGITEATPVQQSLLKRYFNLAELFGYYPPEMNVSWLEEQAEPAAIATASLNFSQLEDAYRQKNPAAYVLILSTLLAKTPVEQLKDADISRLCEELLALSQPRLARELATQSVVGLMN